MVDEVKCSQLEVKTLRDILWNQIQSIKTAERYYWHYTISSRRWDNLISGICMFTSAASIATWYVWQEFPLIWAVTLGVSQVVSVLRPLFPFQKRRSAGNYIVSEISKLYFDAEDLWYRLAYYDDSSSDEEIREAAMSLMRRQSDIEMRYSNIDDFPVSKRIQRKAIEDVKVFLWDRFGTEGAETYAGE